MDVLIRPATGLDLAACVELALEATRESATQSDAWRHSLAADLDHRDRLLLVAETGGQVVGYGRVRFFEPDPDAPPDTAPRGYYLVGLFVRSDRRRGGAGTKLTEARLRWIAERAEEAWFFSNARNSASIALHANLGFEEMTRRFSFPGVTFEGGEGILFRAILPRP